MPMSKIFNNHYYKLIALLIILSTVPVIITGTLSYWQSSKAIINYSNDEKKQNIYQVKTNIEQALQYIDLSTSYFVRPSQTSSILRTNMDATSYNDLRNLKRDLSHIQTLEKSIEDVVFINFNKKWLINNSGLTHLNDSTYGNIRTSYMQIPGKTNWILEEADEIKIPNASQKSCSHYINLVKKLPILTSKPSGIIGVLIPTCELTKIIDQRSETDSYLILDENNQIIAQNTSNTQINESERIPNSLLDEINHNDSDGQFEYQLNGVTYQINYEKSNYNGWTYLSFVKLSEIHKKSSSIAIITILVLSILLSISIFFAILGSKHLYKPVKKLKRIVHSNQGEQSLEEIDDEFDLIETHLEQLLNKNNQLEQRVQNFVPQLKQLFMIRLIQGKVKEDEIPAKLRSLQYKKEWTWLMIFSLKIDFAEMGDKKFNKMDQELILFAINNLMEDIISPHERFTPIVMNDTQSTILLTDHLNDAEYTRFINQKAELIQKKVNELFQLTISIGISRRYKYLHETKKAYRESDEALKYRLKMGPGSIIFYDNLNREPINLVPFPAAINHQILDAIKMTDKEKTIKLVIDFFGYIDQNDVYDFQFDVILSRFLYDLFELKELLGVQIEHFDSTREITHYQHLSSLREIRDWVLYDITLPLIEELKHKNDSKDRKISDTIMRMIRENYNKEIYLDAVAAELHYNAKYLSSIFQKESGYTFSEYLLHYRLEKAKEWLITTCKPVKHIAEELKYNNPQNFIRSFKKMEGVTPGRYRAIYRKETKKNNTANT